MATLRVFDALIANTDRNKGNLLIDKDWTTWFIDHTRAFRRAREILDPTVLVRCDRRLFEALKALDAATVKTRTDRWLTGDEITAILARRDDIVRKLRVDAGGALHLRPASAAHVPASGCELGIGRPAAHSTVRRRPSSKGTIGA